MFVIFTHIIVRKNRTLSNQLWA